MIALLAAVLELLRGGVVGMLDKRKAKKQDDIEAGNLQSSDVLSPPSRQVQFVDK